MIGSYARQSNEDASKYSISSQLSENREKVRKQFPNEPIKEYIDDGHTGEFLDRPGLMQLRKDVRDGIIKIVVCFDPDRLSRKLMNQLIVSDEFERRGVTIIFVNGEYAKTPEGTLFYSMRGAISEFEKAKINERMSRGRREKAKEGKIVKESYIYGYATNKETEELETIEEEAQIVKLIFDLFTTPHGLTYYKDGKLQNVKGINGIAHYLTYKGVPTKKGGDVWHRQVVRQILLNETYTGIYFQNKWNTEGMLGNKYRSKEDKVPIKKRPREEWLATTCPVIIDEFQFQQAQRLLGESKRRFAKQSLNPYLLSGIIRCGECGNTMTGRKAKNWGKHVFEYTDVKNTAGAKNAGCGNKVKCEDIDKHVWEALRHWLDNPDEIAAAKEEDLPKFETNELQRIQNRLDRIQVERKRVLQLFKANMDIGEEMIREEFASLKKEEEELARKKEEFDLALTQSKNMQNTKHLLREAADYFLSIGEITFEHKQNLIRHVIKEVRLFKDETVLLVPF